MAEALGPDMVAYLTDAGDLVSLELPRVAARNVGGLVEVLECLSF